jgi:O-methyltransferase involved in polyketide biosynthesis
MVEVKKSTAIGLREASPLTAEIVAALRTHWTDAPEAKALTTFTGQMLANIFERLAPESVRNIGLARERGMDYLVDKHLGNGEGKIFVDLACGFSARGVLLAKKFPALTVIEIDLRNIIAQKKSRYIKSKIALPSNHEFVAADLKAVNLMEALNGRKADIVMARGLLIYFKEEDIRQAAAHVLTGLKPGGRFIADMVMASKEELSPFQRIGDFFQRQTHSDARVGRFETKEEGITLFKDLGYENVDGYLFSDLEQVANLPTPNTNMMLMVDAQFTSEKTATAKQTDTHPVTTVPPSPTTRKATAPLEDREPL